MVKVLDKSIKRPLQRKRPIWPLYREAKARELALLLVKTKVFVFCLPAGRQVFVFVFVKGLFSFPKRKPNFRWPLYLLPTAVGSRYTCITHQESLLEKEKRTFHPGNTR